MTDKIGRPIEVPDNRAAEPGEAGGGAAADLPGPIDKADFPTENVQTAPKSALDSIDKIPVEYWLGIEPNKLLDYLSQPKGADLIQHLATALTPDKLSKVPADRLPQLRAIFEGLFESHQPEENIQKVIDTVKGAESANEELQRRLSLGRLPDLDILRNLFTQGGRREYSIP
jgi:hypothetical protein